MAYAGRTQSVSPPPPLRAYGGLLPTLRAVGAVIDLGDSPEDRAAMSRIEWWPIGCGDVGDWAACQAGIKTPGTQPGVDSVTGWTVYARDDCDAAGFTMDERGERARELLRRKTSNAIGQEMWRGDIAAAQGYDSASLSQTAVDYTDPAGPSPVSFALGNLQDALVECLGDEVAGIIHATRETVTQWYKLYLVYWDMARGIMTDPFGNLIISSGGYDGSGPDGTVEPGAPYAYATGPVVVRLGPELVVDAAPEVLDRTTNDVEVLAERAVSYQFDTCCVAGIQLSICSDLCEAVVS